MRVTVNGEPRDLPDSITVAELVGQLGLNQRRIAVELNRDILPREHYEAHSLHDGDVLEIVHFIGGG